MLYTVERGLLSHLGAAFFFTDPACGSSMAETWLDYRYIFMLLGLQCPLEHHQG